MQRTTVLCALRAVVHPAVPRAARKALGKLMLVDIPFACQICGTILTPDRFEGFRVLRHGQNVSHTTNCPNVNKFYEPLQFSLAEINNPDRYGEVSGYGYDHLTQTFRVRGRIVSRELVEELLYNHDSRKRT
jgi:hypothetical protein